MMSSRAWQAVLDHLDEAAELAKLDVDVHRMLRTPRRVLEVAIPVRLDDGTVEVFTGWRVHHDTTRGPGKGGVRFHPELDADEQNRWGRIVEYDETDKIFTNPSDRRTEDYVTGKVG